MFKHLARKLINDSNEVVFFIQERGIIEKLIVSDRFTYRYSVSKKLRMSFKGRYGIILRGIISLLQQEIMILSYCLTHRVSFLLGSDIAIAHVGYFLRIPVFVFSDDDYVFTKPYCKMAYPFASHIVAPSVADVNKWEHKKLAYSGTQKSAYLHPKYFSPDESILDKYDLRDVRYFIIRLVTYDALHDSLHDVVSGIGEEVLDKLLHLLLKHGKVIISLEDGYRDKYNKHLLRIDPNDMHSLIYFADMFIGDSQSMHVEACLLGTPAIRSNKWVLAKDRVNVIDYLETQCNLAISIPPNDGDAIIEEVQFLLNSGSKEEAKYLSKRFFEENTNLTDFLFWLLSKYPESYYEFKRDKNIIKEFH